MRLPINVSRVGPPSQVGPPSRGGPPVLPKAALGSRGLLGARPVVAKLRDARGFTLVEIMVATLLSSIILAAVMSTYLVATRAFRAVANYTEIHNEGRLAIDYFARDMRGVNSVVSFGASNLVVTVPTAFNNLGGVTTNKTVTYSVSSNTLYRTDSAEGLTRPLARNIHNLEFALFDKVGNPTTILSVAKGIQIEIKLRKYVLHTIQSEDFLSARLDMRNIQ